MSRAESDSVAAVPALLAMLKDEDRMTRERSILALQKIGPTKAAIPTLIERWKTEGRYLRPDIARTLKKIDREAAKRAGVP